MNVPILKITFDDKDKEFIISRINKILETGYLAMGKNVLEFENKFAEFCGTKHAIGANNGTSALEIALRCFNVENKSVIVPTNTFMATVFAPVHAGAKVIFTDVTKEDLSIDPNDLNEKIQKNTKAVILVHVGGIISSHLKEIQKICNDNDILLLEDAAHAHGTTFNGQKAGSLSKAAAFSFYPTKVMTCGEGGMVTTDDDEINKLSRTLRDEGKTDTKKNIHPVFGNNWRLSEIHAVVGLAQLNKIDWILNERRRIAKFYDEHLKNVNGIKLIKIPENIKSSYYKYIVYLDDDIDREKIKKELKEKYNVSLTGEVYEYLCHSQPVFDKYPHIKLNKPTDTFPNAEYVASRQICLPLYPGLTEEKIRYVIESLKGVL